MQALHLFAHIFCRCLPGFARLPGTDKQLTICSFPGQIMRVKITRTGQVTIPPAMRRKHGLRAQSEVELVDQPGGVLVVKAVTTSHGKRVLATLLRGGKIKGRTKDWLQLTRG